jgi:hypothetical protein
MQTTKLPFAGKPVTLRKPTDAQAAALMLATRKGEKSILRFFAIIEALVDSPDDWEFMEDQMITGKVEVKDFADLLGDLFKVEWPDEVEEGE